MLRNMVASEAPKSEISDAMDTMMEEVSQQGWQSLVVSGFECFSLWNTGVYRGVYQPLTAPRPGGGPTVAVKVFLWPPLS